jgi:hypothetical protein
VYVGWDELQGAVVAGNCLLEGCAGFVVHDVQRGLSACGGEACEDVRVGCDAMCVLFGSKGADQDGVGVCV